jgi:hypothetical protein
VVSYYLMFMNFKYICFLHRSGSEALYAQASAIEVLWQDFSHKLGDQVLIPLNTYTAQFPEMRVNKFNSKLKTLLIFATKFRKKLTNEAESLLIMTVNVIPSKVFKQMQQNERTISSCRKDARALKKPNELMNF